MNTSEFTVLRNYVALAYRYKWRALACLVATVLLAVLWIRFAPREYESEAKLFVRVGRENAALDPTITKGESISFNTNREEEINSIVEHLRSRAIFEKTLDLYAPGTSQDSPETRDNALRRLQNAVYVASPRMSTVVTIQGRAASPQEAQTIVATLVKVYLEEHMRINRVSGSYEFFLTQSGLLKSQLDAAQAALRDAKDKAGMASVEGRRAALEGQISALETQIQQVGAQHAASAAKLKSLETSVSSLPEPLLRQMLGGMPHDGLATMEDQLFQLRIREQEALSKYTPDHPRAIAIHQQVQEVETALKRQTPDRKQIVSALTAAAAADVGSLTVQNEKLQAQLDQLRTQLVAVNEAESQIAQRTREVRQLETQYLNYTAKREEARMDQALKVDRISNVNILQPASFEPKAVRPQKAVILFIGLIAGVMGAVLVVVFSDQSRGSPAASANTPAAAGSEGPFVVVRSSQAVSAPTEGNGTPAYTQWEHSDT
jgi:uncharacterized protein involved in exopolysaccharide biosynthesis